MKTRLQGIFKTIGGPTIPCELELLYSGHQDLFGRLLVCIKFRGSVMPDNDS